MSFGSAGIPPKSGSGEWSGRKNPANLQIPARVLVVSTVLYGPRPTGVVLHSNRPAFGLNFNISVQWRLLFRPLWFAVAGLLLVTANSPASIVRTASSPGFEVTADLFADNLNVISLDRVTTFLSGIASATVWETTGAIFAPLLDAASHGQNTDSQNMADYRIRLEAIARARLRIARLAALAAIREIGLAALACWILSFVAWQIRDTSPRRILR